MLDSLDTLLAFTLIFTVVSLLITITVQMISSALNLRGRNLAWGLAEAFKAIDKDLALGVEKGKFWQQLLSLPKWCLEKLRILPAATKAKQLADHCLSDSLLSDFQIGGIRRPASAVRADELFDLLYRIAKDPKSGAPDEVKKHVKALFKGLGVPVEMAEAEYGKLEALKGHLDEKLSELPDGSPLKQALKTIEEETSARLTAETDFAKHWVGQGEAGIKTVYQKFEHWFDAGQERSQDWFSTHVRLITLFLGVLFAFGLQLDTREIFKLVSSNRELRANLVAQVKPILDQGEKILKESPTVLKNAVQNLDTSDALKDEAMKAEAAKLKNLDLKTTDNREAVRRKAVDAYKTSLIASLDKVLEKVNDTPDEPAKAELKTWRETIKDQKLSKGLDGVDLTTWTKKADLEKSIKGIFDKIVPESSLLEAFDASVDKIAKDQVERDATNYKAIKGSLNDSGFDLFPKSGLWRWNTNGPITWKNDSTGDYRLHYIGYWWHKYPQFWWKNAHHRHLREHFLGMCFSVLLLSLGAPFWFNTLKSLASLRSSVASNISDEKKDDPKKGEAAKTGTPPPTVL